MASYSWKSASAGNWNLATNWTPSGGPPTSADSATIGATGGNYAVTVNSQDAAGSLTISSANATLNDDGASASLTIGGALAISGGTLNVAATSKASGVLTVDGALNLSGGALTVNTGGTLNLGGTLSQTGGTLTLNGGAIVGGTIQSTAGTLTLESGTLSGVTFDGPLNLTSASGSQIVDLGNGTTVVGSGGSGPGTITVTGDYSELNFDNKQTISNVTINLGNASDTDYLDDSDTAGAGNQVLTLASSVTINVTGSAQLQAGGYSGDAIVNQGVIKLIGASDLQIGGNAFTNSGTLNVANGGSVAIQRMTFTTTASSVITIGAYSSVVIAPTNAWTNLGSITLAGNAALTLGGSMSAASLGSITNSGGTVYIEGTYNNSGQTLNGSASFGQLTLLGGTITGGTATTAGVAFTGSGTLSGVTFDGPLNLTSSGQNVHLGSGTTVVGSSGSGPGTIYDTGASSRLYFDITQTVSNVTINLGNASSTDYLYDYDAGAGGKVLTLASNVTINATGSAQISDGGNSGDGIVNNGVIDQTGGNLNIQGNAFTITKLGTIGDSGGALNISATTFTNSGAIQLSGGTLTSGASASLTDAAGSKLSGYGTVTATTFANSGTIEASGGTLTLTKAVTGTGGLQIDGGADLVVGGAIASGASATFSGANATLTLDQPSTFGATIGGISAGDVIELVGITANGATVNGSNQLVVTENGTTVATLQLDGAYSGLSFLPQSVSGGTNIVVQQHPTATVAQYLANPAYYDGLSGGFAIVDIAANITTHLDQLNDPKMISITISDNGAIGVSVAQLTSDATAIGKLANANANPYQLAVTDTAAHITAGVDGLDGSNIVSITISDNGAVGVSVAQLTSDAAAIGKLANQNSNPYQLAVTDTAANVTAALSTLEADAGHIASIAVSGGPVTVSAATALADEAALDKIVGGYAISDSLPNIVAKLSALDADPNIDSLAATSGVATLSGGIAIAAPAFSLTGSGTTLTLSKNLAYSGALNIGSGATVSVSSGDTLTLTGTNTLAGAVTGSGTLAIAGGTTNVTSGASVSAAKWTLSGTGTNVVLGEAFTYSGVFSAGSGDALTLSGGDLTLSGPSSTLSETVIGGTFVLDNTTTLTEKTGTVTIGDASGSVAGILNTATGIWNITDNSSVAHGASASSSFSNSGLFDKTGGSGRSTVSASFTDTGTVTAAMGTLAFSGPTTSFAGALTGAGAIAITGGSATIGSGTTASVATLWESGPTTSLTVAESFSYAGVFNQSGGSLSVSNGDTLSLSGTTTLAGKVTGAGKLAIAGGTATVKSGAGLTVANWTVSGASTDLVVGSLTYAGVFSAGSGATVSVSSNAKLTLTGTNTLGGAVIGLGTLAIAGGTTNVASGASVSAAKWMVSGTGTNVVLGGALTYSGTFSAGSGGALTLSGGDLTLNGTTTLSGAVIGGTFTLDNTAALTEKGGTVTIGDASGNVAGISNTATGTWNITDNSSVAHGASASSSFSNSGLFEKTGGSQRSTVSASFADTGTVTVAMGTLAFSGPTTSFAGALTGAGAIAITGGSTTIASGTTASVATLWESGPTTSLTVAENFSYAGVFNQSGGSLSVSNGDTLSLSGTTTLAGEVTGAGTLAIAGGTATLHVGAPLTVANLTVSGAGTNIILGGARVNKGAFSVSAGATITLSGGNLTLTGANSFAGATIGGGYALADSAAATVSGLTIGGTTTFDNMRTLTESGGAVTVGDASGNAATLVNGSTGTWDIADDSGIGLGSSSLSAITNSGLFEKTGGTGTSLIAPAFANAHNLIVSSGALDLQGAVTGTGADTISGASTLEFDSTIAATQTIKFSGGAGTLDLTDPLGYGGSHIFSFAASDMVDLAGLWSEVSFNESSGVGTLVLTNGTNNVALNFTGNFTQHSFTFNETATETIIGHS